MNSLLARCITAASLLWVAWPATAQTSPSLDPSFPLMQIYQRTSARVAFQMSSGARVVVGFFDRAAGQSYTFTNTALVRYLPNGNPDVAFNATVSAAALPVSTLAEAANGKLLVGLQGAATFGGQLTPALVQLNADGTPDPAFANPALGIGGFVSRLLVQPDGRIVVGGVLTFLNQAVVPGLARLNADGTVDATFQPQLASGRITNVSCLARQADGKLLVTAFVEGTGSPTGAYQLLRLQPNGSQDLTFQPVLRPNVLLSDVAVQPDGQILVSSGFGPLLPGGTSALARFSPTGVADASFAAAPGLNAPLFTPLPMLAVQPDGRILVGYIPTGSLVLPAGQSPVVRLLANGSFDPTWNVLELPADFLVPRANSFQLLNTGQVLVAGILARLGARDDEERGVALLETTGRPSNDFRPVLQQNGEVRDVTQQPDGRLVAVGSFSEVNDQAVRGIVRLELNGAVDTAFCRRARLTGGSGTRVVAQPDGTLLVAGTFARVGSTAQLAVARLLPDSTPDAAFSSPFTSGRVTEMARQADGFVLLAGSLRLPGVNMTADFTRLTLSGGIDAGFQAPFGVTPLALLPLPDGTILMGSAAAGQQVQRLLNNGYPDQSFTAPTLTATGTASVSSLARQPDGRLLIGGTFTQVGGVATNHVARLFANGPPDATFASQQFQNTGQATSLAVQPNGRVLLAGKAALLTPAGAPALYRLLADGSPDPSFDSSRGPAAGRNFLTVNRILVQANGAIVAAGGFSMVSGLPVLGLTRLLDPNVLGLRAATPAPAVQAWPVPAHGQLHLALSSPHLARRVSLLNSLGQVVFVQHSPTPLLTINIASLNPGLYVVRVDYDGTAPAIRRVLVE